MESLLDWLTNTGKPAAQAQAQQTVTQQWLQPAQNGMTLPGLNIETDSARNARLQREDKPVESSWLQPADLVGGEVAKVAGGPLAALFERMTAAKAAPAVAKAAETIPLRRSLSEFPNQQALLDYLGVKLAPGKAANAFGEAAADTGATPLWAQGELAGVESAAPARASGAVEVTKPLKAPGAPARPARPEVK